ncbi:MAG: hypothetical protein AAFQ92_29945, partial [Bacteroidota bacterium]
RQDGRQSVAQLLPPLCPFKLFDFELEVNSIAPAGNREAKPAVKSKGEGWDAVLYFLHPAKKLREWADGELPTVWNDVEYCWVAIISLVVVGLLSKCSSSSDILQNVVNQVKEM